MKLGSKYHLLDTPHILFVKNIFSASNSFMHIFNMSATSKSWKNGYVNNPVILLKIIFSASNFFMHIFNTSVTYLQNAEKIQWKL